MRRYKHYTVALTLDNKERLENLLYSGSGLYKMDFTASSPERILRGSTGINPKTARAIAGQWAIVHILDGRASLVPEFAPKNVPLDGTIKAELFYHNGINSVFRVGEPRKWLCTTCGTISDSPRCVHSAGAPLCVCGEPLRSSMERRVGRCCKCQHKRNARLYDYHGRQFRTSPFFNMPESRQKFLHLGTEIEIGGNDGEMDRGEFCSAVNDLLNKKAFEPVVEFERDGSIEEGVECVFSPLTLSAFNALDWSGFYRLASEHDGEFGNVNGVHFHIDRDFFGGEDMLAGVKMEALVYKYFDFFRLISGRKRGNFGYAHEKAGVQGLSSAIKFATYCEHSFAINCANGATIELRIFGGKIDTAGKIKAVRDIAEALAKWAKFSALSRTDTASPLSLVRYISNPSFVIEWLKNRLNDEEAPHSGKADETARQFIAELQKRKKEGN